MKKIILSLLTIVPCTVLFAQSAASDPVVMTVNGVDVPRSEFEYSYNKNNGDGVIDKKTVEEYAQLYANYKLKVAAALDARLDTLTSFREEYATYRDQQVRPTMVTDEDVLTEARKAYLRSKEALGGRDLIHPAHIYFRLSTKASDSEQAAVRQRADSAYQALKAGADFAELAKQISQDVRSARAGGQLPWIGPNQWFSELEKTAYALQPAEFSQPVLAPDGYHIILMTERKQLEPFEELKDVIVRSFEQQGIRNAIAQQRIRQTVADSQGAVTEQQVMDRRADSLAAVDPEMKYLFQEYHDGLLLYEICNRQVWEKASKDEAGLSAWFQAHKKDYTYPEPRYKGIAYYVKDKADVKAVKNLVKSLPFSQWAEALRQTFNPDTVIRIRVEKGIFKPGDNAVVDRMGFKIAPVKAETVNPDYPISAVYGKKLKKYPEDYNDVRSQVVADYQDMLEAEWVASLRRRYPVQINEAALKTVNQHE